MAQAKRLPARSKAVPRVPVIGVFATCDPRIDRSSRRRAVNIVEMTANILADHVKLPDGSPVPVVYTPILVDGEPQADAVARQLEAEGVNILVCTPDTWAFPQLGLISLLQQFPDDIPINLTAVPSPVWSSRTLQAAPFPSTAGLCISTSAPGLTQGRDPK